MKQLLIGCLVLFSFVIPTQAVFAQQDTQTTEFIGTVNAVADDHIRVKGPNEEIHIIPNGGAPGLVDDIQRDDRVIVQRIESATGEPQFVITGFARSTALLWLIALFVAVIVVFNRSHGASSIVNLVVTFLIIAFGVIPFILNGWSPVLVSVVGGTLIMLWSIYFTHGINNKSHAAVLAIAASLLVTGILAHLFLAWTSLTGYVDETTNFLASVSASTLDMRALLLAGIIVGTLGVLDDIAISQSSTVAELVEHNPSIEKKKLFASAMRIGRDHTSAVTNTLILAYTGAAFPLVILMSLGQAPFTSLASTLNNEVVATELVRMLVGSIGVVVVMPIATAVAMSWMHTQVKSEKSQV